MSSQLRFRQFNVRYDIELCCTLQAKEVYRVKNTAFSYRVNIFYRVKQLQGLLIPCQVTKPIVPCQEYKAFLCQAGTCKNNTDQHGTRYLLFYLLDMRIFTFLTC